MIKDFKYNFAFLSLKISTEFLNSCPFWFVAAGLQAYSQGDSATPLLA